MTYAPFRLTAWLTALRLPAQISLALPMLAGMRHAAPHESLWQTMPLLEALCISLPLQAMILYSNDAADAATDSPQALTLVSGGSGVVAAGQLSAATLRRGAFVAGLLGALACLLIGPLLLVLLWFGAILLVWAYDAAPWQLSRHPAGCICQAVGIGLVMPTMGALILVPDYSPDLPFALFGLCLGLSSHILTALPDVRHDRPTGKRTLPVMLGYRSAFVLMCLGLTCATALLPGAPRIPLLDSPAGWTKPVLAGMIMVTCLTGILRSDANHAPTPQQSAVQAPNARAGVPASIWLGGMIHATLWLLIIMAA